MGARPSDGVQYRERSISDATLLPLYCKISRVVETLSTGTKISIVKIYCDNSIHIITENMHANSCYDDQSITFTQSSNQSTLYRVEG